VHEDSSAAAIGGEKIVQTEFSALWNVAGREKLLHHSMHAAGNAGQEFSTPVDGVKICSTD